MAGAPVVLVEVIVLEVVVLDGSEDVLEVMLLVAAPARSQGFGGDTVDMLFGCRSRKSMTLTVIVSCDLKAPRSFSRY